MTLSSLSKSSEVDMLGGVWADKLGPQPIGASSPLDVVTQNYGAAGPMDLPQEEHKLKKKKEVPSSL